jgi:dGTP triphosphohydrolase
MADIILLESKVDAIGSDVKDIKDRVDDLEDCGVSRSDRLLNLEIWKRGNGAKGAEDRLQLQEAKTMETERAIAAMKECLQRAQSDEAIERIASAAARSIVTNARDRDKTTVAKLRAMGPLFTGIAALVASLVTVVAVFAR